MGSLKLKGLKLKETASLLLLAVLISACSEQNTNRAPAGVISEMESAAILGGSAVADSDPLASTTVQILDMETGNACTGSLITSQIVLTAAHCTNYDPRNLLIIFSTKIPSSMEELQKATVRKVVGGKAHGNWAKLKRTQAKDWGDIAVIKFAGSLPAGYKTAKLISSNSTLKNGATVTLAGFGLVDGVNQIPSEELRKVNIRIALVNFSATEILMDQTNGKGACHGDSGGPALVKAKTGGDVIIGVTSRGHADPNDTCERYSVYTSVAANLTWLKNSVSELQSSSYRLAPIPQPDL